MAGRIVGMYWCDPRCPPVVTGLSATRSGEPQAEGWSLQLGVPPQGAVWHVSTAPLASALLDTHTKKKAPWESRSKQCDCISRLIQLIPEARVNSLIQCIIPVQADPRAGIVSRGALLQHAASATLCPRAWLQTALLLSTSFREMLRTNFEGQNSGCFRPFRAFIPLPLPALLDLWSTLLTFKYSKGQISSDLASISRALIFANTSLSAYPLSPLFSIRQLLITTSARQLVDGTIILTRTFKSRLLTHRVQHGAAARALSSSCPFPTAAAEQLSWWSLATLLGQEGKTTFFLDIII